MDALASCDLFVFPSPAEGFPKVILDAMAAGLPVVTSPSGELAALGTNRVVARLDPVPLGVVRSIARSRDDPAATVAMRERGRRFASEHTRSAETARLAGLLARWSSATEPT
jgi:glycosyltransferase involved in cell wall biosynthesis